MQFPNTHVHRAPYLYKLQVGLLDFTDSSNHQLQLSQVQARTNTDTQKHYRMCSHNLSI